MGGQAFPEKGAKAFFIQHYEAFEGLPKERVDAVWRLPFHKITISKWLVQLAADRFGDHDVSLVFNSVDTTQFHAPPRRRQTAHSSAFCTIVYAGRELASRWKRSIVRSPLFPGYGC